MAVMADSGVARAENSLPLAPTYHLCDKRNQYQLDEN